MSDATRWVCRECVPTEPRMVTFESRGQLSRHAQAVHTIDKDDLAAWLRGCALPSAEPIATDNDYGVSALAGTVIVQFLPQPMTPATAMRHAAWLATMAEIMDPGLDFARVLDAVRGT